MVDLESIKVGDTVNIGKEKYEVVSTSFPFGYVNPAMKIRAITIHIKEAGYPGPAMTAEDVRGDGKIQKDLANDHTAPPGESDPTKQQNLPDAQDGPKKDFTFDKVSPQNAQKATS